jgi:hypothetical protein
MYFTSQAHMIADTICINVSISGSENNDILATFLTLYLILLPHINISKAEKIAYDNNIGIKAGDNNKILGTDLFILSVVDCRSLANI